MSKIISPSQILMQPLTMKIIVDPTTGQARLEGAERLNAFAVCQVLIALTAGLLQQLQNQANMIIGNRAPEGEKVMVDSNDEKSDNENRRNNGSGTESESDG